MTNHTHTNVSNAVLLAIGGIDGWGMAWKQTVGRFLTPDPPHRPIFVGTPGMSDVMSVVPIVITPEMVGKTVGVAVAHEIKTGTGQQKENQQKWQQAFEAQGGIYFVTRSPQQAQEQANSVPRIICTR